MGYLVAAEESPESFTLTFSDLEPEFEQEDKKILVGIVQRSMRNFFKSPILREAFKVLAGEGLIDIQPNRGATVSRADERPPPR